MIFWELLIRNFYREIRQRNFNYKDTALMKEPSTLTQTLPFLHGLTSKLYLIFTSAALACSANFTPIFKDKESEAPRSPANRKHLNSQLWALSYVMLISAFSLHLSWPPRVLLEREFSIKK